ncbi:MAG: L-histidine N(alpha)-methyltransferase [Acidobacteriota bacterium]|nr:L-histidine N(alpha)-methyltransferase [Acidobacteriota bacterium]
MTTPRLTTTVLLTEDQLAGDFLAALERRELPEKYFYWFPTSVRAWLSLCGDGAYRNYVRSHTLLQSRAPGVVAHLPRGAITVISLGAGQGTKDLLVLDALRASGRDPQYVPVDASQSLLEMACAAALEAGVPCLGIKADMADARHLAAVRDLAPRAPRLVMLIGNTLGAFDPLQMAGELERLLGPEDHLLVDGEIFSETGTLAGYDNPLNRQFAFGPLRGLGLVEPEDGVLQFETSESDEHPGLYRVSKHFVPARDLTLSVAGETVRWAAGQRVEMNWSGKFSRETFLAILTEAGLAPVVQEVSADERFVMVLAKPAR